MDYEFEFQITGEKGFVTVSVHENNVHDALLMVNASLRYGASDTPVIEPGMIQHIRFQMKEPLTVDDLVRVKILGGEVVDIEPFKAQLA